MTYDRRNTLFAPVNQLNLPTTGRIRRYSTPEKPDLETIYENEAHSSSGGTDQTELDRSRSPNNNKPQTDNNTMNTSRRSRIPAVFLSRGNQTDKKNNIALSNSVGVLSNTMNNTAGPGGGASETGDGSEQPNVVATLASYTSTAMPVASIGPVSRTPVTNTNSTSSSAKQFLIRRVRSRSKSDPQSVPDKSLFSRFFPKKTKKSIITTNITTTTVPNKMIGGSSSTNNSNNNNNNNNNNSTKKKVGGGGITMTTNYQQTQASQQSRFVPIGVRRSDDFDQEEDDEIDERTVSTGSLSDIPQHQKNGGVTGSQIVTSTTRSGSRHSSGGGKSTSAGPNVLTLPTSDSQYYASMSSAPKGYSISYHKRMTKNPDDLRLQAIGSRIQQQNKQGGGTGGGASQLLSLFQDPKRSGAQSPSPMTGSTRISKTLSGQTIITTSASSDRPSTTHCIRPTARLLSSSPSTDADEIFVSDDEIYTHFMKTHTCYDIMPKSSKLVVFDTELPVKKAFYALVYNGVRAAPLWDGKRQSFTGMLTITDFILILQKYYKQPNVKIEELEEHKIDTWREVLREYEKPLLCITPTDSLFEAVRILTENHVHRLPVIDPLSNNVVFILTHKRVLRFFYLYIYDWPPPSFMFKSLQELNVGTYDNIQIIREDTNVIDALGYFVKYRVSALPVVDINGRLVNIYSKFDVIGLAADKTYTNLNMTIKEALSYRKERLEGVAKCYKTESLATCMERIVKAEVHRLVVVDHDEHVIGVLSLSDLLYFVVIRPTKILPVILPTINVLNEDNGNTDVNQDDDNTGKKEEEKNNNNNNNNQEE